MELFNLTDETGIPHDCIKYYGYLKKNMWKKCVKTVKLLTYFLYIPIPEKMLLNLKIRNGLSCFICHDNIMSNTQFDLKKSIQFWHTRL